MKNINNKILNIGDIIAKKREVQERKKTKEIYVESKFLGGNVKAHSLNTGDVHYVRDKMKVDSELGARTFIFLSIDILREREILQAYERQKGDSTLIVSDLFTDAEQSKIINELTKINGWDSFNETDIMIHEINELQGE